MTLIPTDVHCTTHKKPSKLVKVILENIVARMTIKIVQIIPRTWASKIPDQTV